MEPRNASTTLQIIHFGNLERGLDQRHERPQRLSFFKEWMLQKLRRIRPFFSIELKRLPKIVDERWEQVARTDNRWCALRGDQMLRPQRILVPVGWFTCEHLCITRLVRNKEKKGQVVMTYL